MIGRDGPNWCIKWNNHLRTVASYDIWKTWEQRVIIENKDQEEDEDQVPDSGNQENGDQGPGHPQGKEHHTPDLDQQEGCPATEERKHQ